MRSARTRKTSFWLGLGVSLLAVAIRRAPAERIAIARPVAATAAEAPSAEAKGAKGGLHLPKGRAVSFTYTMNDGAGYRWDVQYYGTIGQGTNYAYSGGLYLQISGSSIHSNGKGWMNADGDEIEIGPYNRNGLNIHRRVKVYKDQGLARWLDIYENPGSQNVTVSARVYSNTNWTIGNRTFSSGKGTFTDKDTSFVTQGQGGNAPALWHYVCGPKAKVRPTVNIQNNQIYVNWSLTVPAKKTVVICYFESQNHSFAEATKLVKTFRPRKAMKDLSPTVRRLIVNLPTTMGIEGVELERIESADVVYNHHGDPLFGTLANESFPLETLFGPMILPAKDVIGLASAGGEDDRFRALLTGGQIIAGRVPAGSKVNVGLPSGGTLAVPFNDIRQCAYRISKSRPEEIGFSGPLMILRTGDRVAFDPASVQLRLRTRHGIVPLDAGALFQVTFDNTGHGVHRVTFLNGSRLAGFLEPAEIPLQLKLGPKLTVRRDLIGRIQFAAEERPDGTLDAVVLSNGDELFGRLAEEKLSVRTDYGEVSFRPENIEAMAFSRTHLGRAALQLWDGSILRGQCSKEALAFQISPGPMVHVYVGQFVQVCRSQALPPLEVRNRLEKLVGQLGAESYKDRQAATEGLVKMGKGILPMLRKYLKTSDPEVRQRIEDVIDRLGGGGAAVPGNTPPAGYELLQRRAGRDPQPKHLAWFCRPQPQET